MMRKLATNTEETQNPEIVMLLYEEVNRTNARDVFNLTAKPIRLQLPGGKVLCGNFYTLDPATCSLIILQFHNQGSIRMCMIPSNAFKCLEVVECDVDLPDGCKECTPQLIAWMRALVGIVQPTAEIDNQCRRRGQELINWLNANGAYDAKEEDDHTIRVFEEVLIRPPYTPADCFCDNVRALQSIQSLIEQFDAQSEQHIS